MSEYEEIPLHEPAALARTRQEREVAVSHALTCAEFALAEEGAEVGAALASAGLEFDATTFVALRVIETSAAEDMDPVEVLRSSKLQDLIERAVALIEVMLARRASA
jgi:hypothetical protein